MGFDCSIRFKKNNEYLEELSWEGCGRSWGRNLLAALPFEYNDSTYGEEVELSKDDVCKILKWCCNNPIADYQDFADFSDVESLCRIVYLYDRFAPYGWKCVFSADW